MKLVSTLENGTKRLGIVAAEKVIDAAAAAEGYAAATGAALPAEWFAEMAAFLSAGAEGVAAATAVLDWVEGGPIDLYSTPLATVQFDVPIARPGKIVCVGLNYADHCREQNVAVPERPVLFTKFNTALLPHEGTIRWDPALSSQVDFEGELALIIGRKAQNVSQEEALAYVSGYTVLNDVSARDVQFADGQWVRGKSLDTFCPCGPLVATADSIPRPNALRIQTRVNGVALQDSTTAEMIFQVPYLIAFISRSFTLEAGDIISTGTPHGVGVFREPQVFLRPGDVVEVEIEDVGLLRNEVGSW